MAFTLNMVDILTDMRPGEKWIIREDHLDYSNLEWFDAAAKPTEQEMLDAELAAAKVTRILTVKSEARERCLAVVPDWKQWNIGRGRYNQATMDTLNGLLNTILDDSNTAETAIDALSTVQTVIDFTW